MSAYRRSSAPPPEVAAELSDYPPLIQQLLFNRDIKTAAAAARFLNPSYEDDLHDPFLLPEMDKAVERILKSIREREKIVIFSDYDCDGIPGAVLLHDFFKSIGFADFSNYIPHRHYEGFGLSVEAVETIAKDKPSIIITIDCGTTDHEAILRAKELGVDVIVTDHHEPKAERLPAYAFVNPKSEHKKPYPFSGLCGTGVVFKLVQALLTRGDFSLTPGREKWWLDLVAVATVADMVPLRDENRALAHYGLIVLRKSRRLGLRQLLGKARLSQPHLTEDDIGFTIGPRLNAASRMDAPEDAFKLLTASDQVEAAKRAEHLERLNKERKGTVGAMTREAQASLKRRLEKPAVLVIGNPTWRPALVGLVASKLAETHGCPAFVWGRDGRGVIKGSCRSDGSVSVVALMENTDDAFTEFGGHHFSGGFSVASERIHSLPESLNAAYEKLATGEKLMETDAAERLVEAELTLADLTTRFLSEQARLAPFGVANPKPLFAFLEVVPLSVDKFGSGKEHLKLVLPESGLAREAIAFFTSPEGFSRIPEAGRPFTLLAHVETSHFAGRRVTRLRLVDIL